MTQIGGQSIEQIVASIRGWAVRERIVSQVYVFGSRVKGTSTLGSDIDIAVRILFPDPDIALAHFQGNRDSWGRELAKLLELEIDQIDLQWFHPEATPRIVIALRSAAILVFCRDEQIFSYL